MKLGKEFRSAARHRGTERVETREGFELERVASCRSRDQRWRTKLDFSSGESFDDHHRPTTLGARPKIARTGGGDLWLANCQFADDSSGFPVLLRFCDAQSCSFHPFHRHPGPIARTWRRPFPSCGVASPQAPTLDRESLPATIAQSALVGPDPRRLAGALGSSNSSAPFRNCTEALDTASPSQSYEQAKVSDVVLLKRSSEARPERTERRTHPCGRRNEAA